MVGGHEASGAEGRVEVSGGVVAGQGELVIILEGADVRRAAHDDFPIGLDRDTPGGAAAVTCVELGDDLAARAERRIEAPVQTVSGEGECPPDAWSDGEV